MTISPTVKKMALVCLGPAAVALCEYLQNSTVLTMSTLEHALIAAGGVAVTIFYKQEQAALAAVVPPPAPPAPPPGSVSK